VLAVYNALLQKGVSPDTEVVAYLAQVFVASKDPPHSDCTPARLWKEVERWKVAPNAWCYGVLLRACLKAKDGVTAERLWQHAKDKAEKIIFGDSFFVNLVQALSDHPKGLEEALNVLAWLKKRGMSALPQFYSVLLSLCKQKGRLEEGKIVHERISTKGAVNGRVDEKLYSSLIDMTRTAWEARQRPCACSTRCPNCIAQSLSLGTR